MPPGTDADQGQMIVEDARNPSVRRPPTQEMIGSNLADMGQLPGTVDRQTNVVIDEGSYTIVKREMTEKIYVKLPEPFQDIPTRPLDGPRRSQDVLKTAHDAPKRPQDVPKTPQKAPKTPPRGP